MIGIAHIQRVPKVNQKFSKSLVTHLEKIHAPIDFVSKFLVFRKHFVLLYIPIAQ